MNGIGKKLNELRLNRLNMSMESLALTLGYKGASSIQRYLDDDYNVSFPVKFSANLKSLVGKGSPPITESEVSVFTQSFDKLIPENASVVKTALPTGKIPVYDQAVGGVEGEFLMNGEKLYDVMAPPNVTEASGAYGVEVAGDSMFPRYDDGEILFIDPTRRVKRGDYVVAQIQNGESDPIMAYVKRFISRNSQKLILEQLNPNKNLEFEANCVVSVHFIAGSMVS